MNTNFINIVKVCGYDFFLHSKTVDEITKCMNDLKLFDSTVFLEAKIKKGFQKDLSRPIATSIENKKILMKFLEKK